MPLGTYSFVQHWMSNMPSVVGDCTAKHEVMQQNKQHWKSVISHNSGVGKGQDTVGSRHYHIPALFPWPCYYWASRDVRMGTCCKDWVLLSLLLSISPSLASTSFISQSSRVGNGLSIGPVASHKSLPSCFSSSRQKRRTDTLACFVKYVRWSEGQCYRKIWPSLLSGQERHIG